MLPNFHIINVMPRPGLEPGQPLSQRILSLTKRVFHNTSQQLTTYKTPIFANICTNSICDRVLPFIAAICFEVCHECATEYYRRCRVDGVSRVVRFCDSYGYHCSAGIRSTSSVSFLMIAERKSRSFMCLVEI